MAREQLKLTGIQRNRKNRDFSPGSCNEIINIRFREGAWEAVGNKTIYDIIEGYTPSKVLALHDMIEAKNLIFITDVGEIVSKTYGSGYQVLFSTDSDINATSLNNIIIFTLEDKIRYFVYKDGSYQETTNMFNDFRIYTGSPSDQWNNSNTDYILLNKDDLTFDSPDGSHKAWKYIYNHTASPTQAEQFMAEWNLARNEARKLGVPVGPIKIMATLVLFDDSEIAHTSYSETILAHLLCARLTHPNRRFAVVSKYYDIAKGFKFLIDGIDGNISLIKGIRIYIERPRLIEPGANNIFAFGIDSSFSIKGNYAKTEHHIVSKPLYEGEEFPVLDPLLATTPVNDYTEPLFREVAFIPVRSLSKSGEQWFLETKFDDLENFDTYKELPIDNYSRHSFTGVGPIIYNGRLFISNTKTGFPVPLGNYAVETRKEKSTRIFSTAYNPLDSWNPSNRVLYFNTACWILDRFGGIVESGVWSGLALVPFANIPQWMNHLNSYESEVIYEFILDTTEGEKVIRSLPKIIRGYTMYSVPGKRVMLKGLISYPDTRAIKLNVYIKPKGFTNYWTNSPVVFPDNGYYRKEYVLIQSDYQNMSYVYADILVNSPDDFSVQPDGITLVTLPNVNTDTIIKEPNRVQVSEANNPFVFPAVNSYRVGNSEIIGLQTVNNEMSQGQFGDFPMIAFTKSGIWAMQIGNGSLLISSIVPLANEVCNNKESITAIRKGIFFATNEGLKILQGSQVIDISDLLEGNPNNPIKSGSVYSEVVTKEGFLSSISDEDFLEYIKGARIGYDDYYEELIISNPDKHYSYIFSIINNTWSKINTSFDGFFSKYPYLFAFKGNTVYHTNKETKNTKKILFVTNILNFANAFTKIDQAILRGKLGKGRIIIFGSTDNIKWQMISIGTSSSGGYDLRIPRTFYSCVSFIIAFDGTFERDSYFQHIEIDLKQRYNFKFR